MNFFVECTICVSWRGNLLWDGEFHFITMEGAQNNGACVRNEKHRLARRLSSNTVWMQFWITNGVVTQLKNVVWSVVIFGENKIQFWKKNPVMQTLFTFEYWKEHFCLVISDRRKCWYIFARYFCVASDDRGHDVTMHRNTQG